MNWDQIRELEKEDFAILGHHSHSHEYLIEKSDQDFVKDIEKANIIFNEKIGYIPKLFSYPFGEYSEFMRNYISKNFTFAFGQHSGVIDLNKEKFQLPRFPINESYGEITRFQSIIKTYPLEYKSLIPVEKKLNKENNPPIFSVKFFDNQKNIENVTCYSNEGNTWKKSTIKFNNNTLSIQFREAFLPRRGRVNCSLNDDGKWRWFGTQFIISKN
jgi:peptidoglycan/xylan/chitin deacetylase (PgdA/CDA1 family)